MIEARIGLSAQQICYRPCISQQGKEIFLYCAASEPSQVPTQLSIERVLTVLSLEENSLGREAKDSSPFNAEVEYACNYSPTSLYAFMP
jgi:hypothetical protein